MRGGGGGIFLSIVFFVQERKWQRELGNGVFVPEKRDKKGNAFFETIPK